MFLGSYRFHGDPGELVPAYDRLLASLDVESFDLHVGAVHPGGLVVVDTCPSEAVFRGFVASDEWRAAYTAAGLPTPTVEELGTIHAVHIGRRVHP